MNPRTARPVRRGLKVLRPGLKVLRADLLGTQKRLVRAHDGFVRYRVLNRVFTLLANPDATQRLFIGNDATFRRGLQHKNLARIFGSGLISSDGERWRRQRRLAQPVFTRDLLVRVVETTAMATTELLDRWTRARERDEPVEVFGDMQRLTMRVMADALFGRGMGTVDSQFREACERNVEQFREARERNVEHFVRTIRVGLEVAVRRNISPVTLPLWFPTRRHRRLGRCLRELDRFIEARVTERLADQAGYTDMLGDLVRSYGDLAAPMRRELRDQVVTLFFAGFETSATALAWTLLLLSQNEDAEDWFHRELADVLGGRAPTYDDLGRLTYTNQVIRESMRLYPPVYNLTRSAGADHLVAGCQVRRGDNLVVPIHALHRMAAYWDDPDAFCPERFAPDRLTETQRNAYLPFSAGQRKCMGANFATAEMLTVLATIGQRVRLRLVAGHPVAVAVAVTQYPRHGLRMRVEARES
jgi:cytochrome P450